MKRGFLIIFCMLLIPIILGCAEIESPNPAEILSHPLGKDPLRIGITKDKVLDMWGRPDVITRTGTNELGASCEEWIYHGRYPNLPIDAGYLYKTKYLYFEGNTLVRWEREN
jgi:hypothetical protein